MTRKETTMTATLRLVGDDDDAEYVRLQSRIETAEENASADLERHRDNVVLSIRARWEFGQRVLAERGDNAKLPNGRTATICELAGISQSELSYRTRFAETHDDEAFTNALVNGTSWHDITQGLGTGTKRKQRKPKSDKDSEDDDAMMEATMLNAFNALLRPFVDRRAIRRYSPQAKTLMIDALKQAVAKLEETL